MLLGIRGKGVAAVPPYREETRQLKPGHAGALHRRANRPQAARRRQRPLHRGRGAADAARGRAWRGGLVGGGIAQAAEQAVPATSTTTWPSWSSAPQRRTWPSGRPLPGRTDQGLRGAPPRTAHVRPLGPAAGAGRTACLLVSEVVTNGSAHLAAAAPPSPDSARARGRARAQPRRRAGVPTVGPDEFGNDYPAPPKRRFTLRLRRGRGGLGRGLRPDMRLPGSAARPRPMRAARDSTWSISSPPGGDPGRPRTARRCGSRWPSAQEVPMMAVLRLASVFGLRGPQQQFFPPITTMAITAAQVFQVTPRPILRADPGPAQTRSGHRPATAGSARLPP